MAGRYLRMAHPRSDWMGASVTVDSIELRRCVGVLWAVLMGPRATTMSRPGQPGRFGLKGNLAL
jgi:hypothetical protein